MKFRIRVGLQKWNRPLHRALAILCALFLLTGGYISYNKYVVNKYASRNTRRQQLADYEKKYSQYRFSPQPTIKNVNLKVDLFSEERKVDIQG